MENTAIHPAMLEKPTIAYLFHYWSEANDVDRETPVFHRQSCQRFEPVRKAMEDMYWQIVDKEADEPNVADTVGLVMLEQLRQIQSQEQSKTKGFSCPLPPIPAEAYNRVGGWDAFWAKVNEMGGQEAIFQQYTLDLLISEYLDNQEEPDFWPWFYSQYYSPPTKATPPAKAAAPTTKAAAPTTKVAAPTTKVAAPTTSFNFLSSSSNAPSIAQQVQPTKAAAPTTSFSFSSSNAQPVKIAAPTSSSSSSSSSPSIAQSKYQTRQTRQTQQKPVVPQSNQTQQKPAEPPKLKQKQQTQELLLPATWVQDSDDE